MTDLQQFYIIHLINTVYSMIRSYKNIPAYTYPFGGTNGSHELSMYLHSSANIQIIGWNRDEKSFYVADFASVHARDFSPDKQFLNEE
ncbi:hypothetical protein EEL32_12330 [Brevibacillus laterosporus]|nr:hypothetical protein [Brevibacillus laterosporus]TPG86883.1 hypothetical protein EEL32_12330 [Brevibacillus laterosporus]